MSHTSNLHGQHDPGQNMSEHYNLEHANFHANLDHDFSLFTPLSSPTSPEAATDTGNVADHHLPKDGQSVSGTLPSSAGGRQCGIISPSSSSSAAGPRFGLVLLSTFPRSGNSWTRALFRGSTLLDSRLTTVKGLASLQQATTLTHCLPEECSDSALGGYLLGMVRVLCLCPCLRL